MTNLGPHGPPQQHSAPVGAPGIGVPPQGGMTPPPDGATWILPIGRSPWAIAAGYAGLFALTVYAAPIALALSVIAMIHLRKNPKLLGWGRAVFGLVMGLAFTTLLVVILASRR